MSAARNAWAPLPLRLALSVSLVYQGYPKLFTALGHQNIVQIMQHWHVPLPGLVGYAVGSIELFGGLAIFAGAWTRLAAALNIFSTGGHLLLALLEGGYPPPLPGQQALPGYEQSAVMLACLAALLLGGAGRWSIDRRRELRRLAQMQPLTVAAPIKQGEEPELRRVLAAIDEDPGGNPYVQFPQDRISHFARFLVTPPRPGYGPRLLFASVYNGELDAYLAELVRVSPGLDDVWGHCEGYPGRAGFLPFAYTHAQSNRALYFGFPDETLTTIRTKIGLRRQLEDFLRLPQVARYLEWLGVVAFLDLLSGLAQPPALLCRLWAAIAAAWRKLCAAVHAILLQAVLDLAQWASSLGVSKVFPRISPNCTDTAAAILYIEHLNALQQEEGRFVQTPFTVFADVKRCRAWRIRLAMVLAQPLLRWGWPPGDFSSVYTLHDFRWLLLDGGKRLMFMSDFDGSAQNYLGDFLDHLNWGLDLFYANCVGYPAGGMREVGPFVQWVRSRQLTQQVYYSAYPGETVMNLIRDREITSMMEADYSRAQAESWLRLL
jgi:uncharacterized membrane protein YphA (DoxX/SURF4 family)